MLGERGTAFRIQLGSTAPAPVFVHWDHRRIRAYGPRMQGQVISGHVVCQHCLVQQRPQARTALPHCSASRVRHRRREHLCTRAAKEDANSSAEDLLQDSRAEARRRRRESRQPIEPTVEPTVQPTDEPTFNIDPVSQPKLEIIMYVTCLAGQQQGFVCLCMGFRRTLK